MQYAVSAVFTKESSSATAHAQVSDSTLVLHLQPSYRYGSRGKEKNAVSKEKFENTAPNCMASNDWMLHNELARIWSDAVSIFTYEVKKNTKIRMLGTPVKIRTAFLM